MSGTFKLVWMAKLVFQSIIWPAISPLVDRAFFALSDYFDRRANAVSEDDARRDQPFEGKWREAQYRGNRDQDAFDRRAEANRGFWGSGPRQLSQRDRHLKVLGLSREASPDAIRARYRQLAKRYHPDQFAASGEAIFKAAAEKMRQINEAYDALTEMAPES
ncbi:MAG: J domain-containing protein [Pseudomonadota bacterium]